MHWLAVRRHRVFVGVGIGRGRRHVGQGGVLRVGCGVDNVLAHVSIRMRAVLRHRLALVVRTGPHE